MGKKFTKEEPQRFLAVLQKAKNKLVENGFNPDKLEVRVETEPYPTVSE